MKIAVLGTGDVVWAASAVAQASVGTFVDAKQFGELVVLAMRGVMLRK